MSRQNLQITTLHQPTNNAAHNPCGNHLLKLPETSTCRYGAKELCPKAMPQRKSSVE